MGLYINPPDGSSKELWLSLHGTAVFAPRWTGDGKSFPVCLVNNGPFTAAGVAFSKAEMDAFNGPNDIRPKQWFIVSADDINDVTNGGLTPYLR